MGSGPHLFPCIETERRAQQTLCRVPCGANRVISWKVRRRVAAGTDCAEKEEAEKSSVNVQFCSESRLLRQYRVDAHIRHQLSQPADFREQRGFLSPVLLRCVLPRQPLSIATFRRFNPKISVYELRHASSNYVTVYTMVFIGRGFTL